MQPAAALFQPFPIASKGARLRAARFAAAAPYRGTVLLLTGQSEFIEKYFEVIDELRARGFAVATMDWRGQGGSERPMPGEPMKIWVDDFAEYDADMAALLEQGARPMLAGGEKPYILAHSMGAHIALRTLAEKPELFAAAMLSAPMMAIRFPLPAWVPRRLSAAMAQRRSRDFAWGIAGRDPLKLAFEKQIVTSDPARYARTQAVLAAQPSLRVGGPTWGWLAAATRSMAAMLEPGVAERIALPVCVCDVGNDLVCDEAVSARFAGRLPDGTYRKVAGARHEILMERGIFRAQFWQAFDAFLKPL